MAGHRLKNYSRDELRNEIEAGARCVTFNYCFSLIHSIHGESEIFLVRRWWDSFRIGLGYTAATAIMGWWSVHGIFLTPIYLLLNLSGGSDVTDHVLATLQSDVLASRLVAADYQQISVDMDAAPPKADDFLKNLEREHRGRN